MDPRLPFPDTVAMKSLLQSGKFSDLTIMCKGFPFKLHRAVVCPASSWFAAACDSRSARYIPPPINLNEDLISLQYMFDWMYTGGYKEETPRQSHDDDFLLIETKEPAPFSTIQVYALAQKYDVPGLQESAKKSLHKWSEQNWEHEDFPALVKEVYKSTASTDRGLREVVATILVEHAKQTLFGKREEFRDIIGNIGVVGIDILRVMVSKLEKEREITEGLFTKDRDEFQQQLEKARFDRASLNNGIAKKNEKIKELEAQLEAQRKATIEKDWQAKKCGNTELARKFKNLSVELSKSNQGHQRKGDRIRELEASLGKAVAEKDRMAQKINIVSAELKKANLGLRRKLEEDRRLAGPQRTTTVEGGHASEKVEDAGTRREQSDQEVWRLKGALGRLTEKSERMQKDLRRAWKLNHLERCHRCSIGFRLWLEETDQGVLGARCKDCGAQLSLDG